MSTDTPRTDGFEIVVEGESPVMGNRYRAWAIFSRTLERELAAKDAEIARLKADGASEAFVTMSLRAEKAEAELCTIRNIVGPGEPLDGVVEKLRVEAERLYGEATAKDEVHAAVANLADFMSALYPELAGRKSTESAMETITKLRYRLGTAQAQLAAKDAEIDLLTQLREHDVSHWKARAEKAEADVRETYRAWLGRDYQHLELPAAIGKMRADLERELAAARLDTERLDWLENGGVSFDYDPGFPAVGFDGNYGPEPGQPPFWGAHINQKGLAMAATLRAAIDAARKDTP